jgi:hypothetical protein
MRAQYFKLAAAIALIFPAAYSATAESALMGWQTERKDGYYVYKAYMLGPTQMNNYPARKGSFKGEFSTRTGDSSKLIAVYRVWFSKDRKLRSEKVEFRVSPLVPGANQPDPGRTDFTTQLVSFGDGDSFILVFTTKEGKDKAGTEMILLPIVRVFVPS